MVTILISAVVGAVIALVIANNRNTSKTNALIASYEAKLKAAATAEVAKVV